MTDLQRPAGRDRLSGFLLVTGALVGLAGNSLHPHSAQSDPAATFIALAGDATWTWIHLAIIVAVLLIAGGLIGLASALRHSGGEGLAALGAGATLVGAALVTVSTAIDGFGIHALSVAAASAGVHAEADVRTALAVRTFDFGIWSIGMLVLFGGAFTAFGAAILTSGRMGGAYGWVAIVGGLGSAVAATLQLAAGTELQLAESIFLLSSMVLTAWAAALGVRLWRGVPDAHPAPLLAADAHRA